MKKTFIYAFLGAIALSGATGFTSCSSTDDVEEVNPSYDPKTGDVNVQFIFNVSTGNQASTRMTAANTQADITQTFRGITDAQILTFSLGSDGSHVYDPTTQVKKLYNMGTILTSGALDPDGTGTPQSRRIIELSLPTGTNALVFYGKAPKTLSDFQQGKSTYSANMDLASATSSLARIVPESDTDKHGTKAFKQYENVIAAVLTRIINTSITYNVDIDGRPLSGTVSWPEYAKWDETKKVFTLADYDPTDDSPTPTKALCPLGEILGNAFATFNTIVADTREGISEAAKQDELRAGSGEAVAVMMSDLAQVLNKVGGTGIVPTSSEEAVANRLGTAILTNIRTVFDEAFQWKYSQGDMTPNSDVIAFSGLAAGETNLVTENLNTFPTNFNLPKGSTILLITKNTENDQYEYAYMDNVPTYAMGGSTSTSAAASSFDPKNYVYPPELTYFGNSPLRISNESLEKEKYPDGSANWDNDTKWTDLTSSWTKSSHVLSTTRSVAMQENINYATALLKSTVRYNILALKDNNKNIQKIKSGATEEDQTIDVSSAGAFQFTGVLVGGQNIDVGWNFIAKGVGNNAPTFNAMVYDRDFSDLTSTYVPNSTTEKTGPVYTLLWDNWEETSEGQQRDVYIALEFVNNTGKDFWGLNNLIRRGQTFYLIGKLTPPAPGVNSTIKWPLERTATSSDATTTGLHYALPPYDNNGNTIKQARVFMQDYMTEANFVIGEKSLQSALVTLPDLRSAQISLGLSVDLKWETGMKFEDVILGQ